MRVVLCFPVTDEQVEQLRASVPECEFVNAGQERVAAELPHADIFCGHAKVPVPWAEVVRGGRLRWIQSSAAGLDHCLTPEVVESDIVVTSASGLFANQVAEQTVCLLMGLVRSLPTFFRAAQRREFIRRPTSDLWGSTVGIAGFGGNGRRIAEVLRPFGVKILATDLFPFDRPDYVDELLPATALPDILPKLDVLILAVPLTEVTRAMIDRSVFRSMKPSSLLINVARGQVVNEADLVAALEQHEIAGAGLDVTEVEPLPAESPLWEREDVIITPHVGAQSIHRVPDTVEFFCRNLKSFLAGEPLLNQVDKRLGFPRREPGESGR